MHFTEVLKLECRSSETQKMQFLSLARLVLGDAKTYLTLEISEQIARFAKGFFFSSKVTIPLGMS